MSMIRQADQHNKTPCSRCGWPASVIVVDRMDGTIAGYACLDCDTLALQSGPHLDYPLDTNARQSAANRAIEDYYAGRS